MPPSSGRPPGWSRLAEITRFGLMSLLSALVTLGLPILLHEAGGMDPRIAVAIAFVVVFVMNFLTTRYFVFRHSGDVWTALRKFLASSLAFRAAEYAAFLGLFALGLRYYLAQAIVVGIATVLKFVLYRDVVFKPPGRAA